MPRRAPHASEVFLDAGYIIAVLKDEDAHHAAAVWWARHYADRRQLTTTVALTESCDAAPSHERWRTFRTFLVKLRADPSVTIVPVDAVLLDRAVNLRQKNLARKWGLADCISFVVMRDHGVTDALTADRHFHEAGFNALLRDG